MPSQNHIPDSKPVINSASPEQSRCKFGEVLAKDYGSNTFGFDDKVLSSPCIDLDTWEISRSGSNDCTMDAAVGIASFNTVSRKRSNHRLLLVEMKLGVTGARFNPRKGELEGKVTHSRAVLLVNHNVDPHNFFIVPTDYLSQALNELSRWKRGSGSAALASWEFLDPPRFNNLISLETDFPYIPKTDIKAIEDDIKAAVYSDAICKAIRRWMDVAQDYANRFVVEEARFILQNLIKITTEKIKDIEDEEEREYLTLELEDARNQLLGLSCKL